MSKEQGKVVNEVTKFEDFNSVEELYAWASKAIDSGLLPNAVTEPEQVMTIVQHGKELGISPFVALNNIHVISGRPTLSSAMVGSLLKRRGIEWVWDEDFAPVKDDKGNVETAADGSPNRRTTIHFFWKSVVTDRVMEATHSVTWAQMGLAGYTSKENWIKYPKEIEI